MRVARIRGARAAARTRRGEPAPRDRDEPYRYLSWPRRLTWRFATAARRYEGSSSYIRLCHRCMAVEAVQYLTRAGSRARIVVAEPNETQRFNRPAPTGDPPGASDLRALLSAPHDRPEIRRRAHASKAAHANQLPASLSAKRTAAFWSALRPPDRRCSVVDFESCQGQFQGQFGLQQRSRNSKPVVYLGFSPR